MITIQTMEMITIQTMEMITIQTIEMIERVEMITHFDVETTLRCCQMK